MGMCGHQPSAPRTPVARGKRRLNKAQSKNQFWPRSGENGSFEKPLVEPRVLQYEHVYA